MFRQDFLQLSCLKIPLLMSFQKRDKIFIKRSVYFCMSLSVGISGNGLQRGHIVMHSHDRITLFLCYQNYILKSPSESICFL